MNRRGQKRPPVVHYSVHPFSNPNLGSCGALGRCTIDAKEVTCIQCQRSTDWRWARYGRPQGREWE